jgi:hypothetical protein
LPRLLVVARLLFLRVGGMNLAVISLVHRFLGLRRSTCRRRRGERCWRC